MTGIYHGWTDTEQNARERLMRRQLAYVEAAYGNNWERDADAVHCFLAAADAGDIGTHVIISGGEVLEIGNQSGSDEIPF